MNHTNVIWALEPDPIEHPGSKLCSFDDSIALAALNDKLSSQMCNDFLMTSLLHCMKECDEPLTIYEAILSHKRRRTNNFDGSNNTTLKIGWSDSSFAKFAPTFEVPHAGTKEESNDRKRRFLEHQEKIWHEPYQILPNFEEKNGHSYAQHVFEESPEVW